MSELRVDVVAIGTLAKNPYWDEKAPRREEYATTTLVRSGEVTLLVDPGWPAEVLRHALFYRAGLEPEAVTHVFLTHFDPYHLAGLGLFPDAVWWAHEEELAWMEAEEPELAAVILERTKAVPDTLAPRVDIFPTAGPTPGHTSVLVAAPLETWIVAGDLVLTRDHFERGNLGEAPWDLEKAKDAFQEVAEIADLVIPGHDNVFAVRGGGLGL